MDVKEPKQRLPGLARGRSSTYRQVWLSALATGLSIFAIVWLVNLVGNAGYPPWWPIEIPGVVLVGGLIRSMALYAQRRNAP